MAVFFFILLVIFGVFITMLIGLFSKNKIFKRIAATFWIGLISLISFFYILDLFQSRMELDKNEIYGEYIINKNKCPGKQANWQYDHYRFKITKDNKIHFYITEKEKIVKTLIGTVEIIEHYTPSPLLKIKFEEPFHIVKDSPTLYREIWTFYYVFHSEKFGNMFFTKGDWESND